MSYATQGMKKQVDIPSLNAPSVRLAGTQFPLLGT